MSAGKAAAAVSVGEYEAAFRKAREEADAVFHVNLGSGFSSCYQNAKIAAMGEAVASVPEDEDLL